MFFKLVKFEQNQEILTTHNYELFDKKSFTTLTIFDIPLAPFRKKFLHYTRDAKFPGILRVVNLHWEFCGNIGNFWDY